MTEYLAYCLINGKLIAGRSYAVSEGVEAALGYIEGQYGHGLPVKADLKTWWPRAMLHVKTRMGEWYESFCPIFRGEEMVGVILRRSRGDYEKQ